MAVSKKLLFLCLLGMVALAAAVDAETQKKHYKKEHDDDEHEEHEKYEHKSEHKHGHKKTMTLYVVSPNNQLRTPYPDTAVNTLGATAVISGRPLSFVGSSGPQQGVLFQSGIYVEVASKEKFLNWQMSIIVDGNSEWPAGTIFVAGDGTGLSDPGFIPRAIVGGAGPYAGARGTISRPEATTGGPYILTFLHWGEESVY